MAKGRFTGGRQWKPGQSGNPNGSRPPADIMAARRLTAIEFERILNKYIHMTREQIVAAAKHPETPALELMIASMISKGTNEGDSRRIEFILGRLLGALPQTIRHADAEGGVLDQKHSLDLSSLSKEQLLLLKQAFNKNGNPTKPG